MSLPPTPLPPIELPGTGLPPVPRILQTIMTVVAEADDPLPGDTLARRALDRSDGVDLDGVVEAVVSLRCAGWLIRRQPDPNVRRYRYGLGPMARLAAIDDEAELSFAVGQGRRRLHPLDLPAPRR